MFPTFTSITKSTTMSKEKDNKKKSDKTPASKSTKEKRVDKLAKRKDKENQSKLTDL